MPDHLDSLTPDQLVNHIKWCADTVRLNPGSALARAAVSSAIKSLEMLNDA
jgi:hypothetical protein